MPPFISKNSNWLAEFPSKNELGPAPRLRLAPTPSGFLHAGNALNFWLNFAAARSVEGGKLILRIDDLDAERKRPEFVEDIFRSLDWLKIDLDEGPSGPDDFEKNWSQKYRLEQYENLLNSLIINDLGLFACRKSRRELEPFGGLFPPIFRDQKISLDEKDAAWRIKTPDNFPMPDFVIRRRDGVPAYQIASLADDLFFKITHLIRGEDLENSSRAQLFLAEKMGLDSFLSVKIWHHPLVKNSFGEKLSKSAGADSLRAMRESGLSRLDFLVKMKPFLPASAFEILMEKVG